MNGYIIAPMHDYTGLLTITIKLLTVARTLVIALHDQFISSDKRAVIWRSALIGMSCMNVRG